MGLCASFALGVSFVLGGDAARAEEPCLGPVCARRDMIPAWTERVTRVVHVPAVLEDCKVPVYETRQMPVYAQRRVPRTEAVIVPTYGVRRVALYEKRRVPVYGKVDVPVWGVRRIPVKLPCWHTRSCTETQVTVYEREEKVQVGVRREPKLLGHREERVQVGWGSERYETGTRTEQRVCGYDTVQIVVGHRNERCIVDWRTDTRIVRPATTRTETEEIAHPCRWVTVVPDGAARRYSLPGTDEVLTETEFALARARIR
jgi:hypothetical protein